MPYVDLAKARLAVMEHKHFLRKGEDPQDRRRLSRDQQTTFAQAANAYIENQKPRWRNPSSLRDAKLLLQVYAKPFAHQGVAHVTANMIEDAIALIPSPAQARRALRVWERVFDFAQAKGFSIPKGNPARWKGFHEYRLPHLKKIDHKHFAGGTHAEDGETPQVTGWSFLQPQIHSAQEAVMSLERGAASTPPSGICNLLCRHRRARDICSVRPLRGSNEQIFGADEQVPGRG